MSEIDITHRTEVCHDLPGQKAAHKMLAEFRYTPSLPERGYTGRALRVDLAKKEIREEPIPDRIRELFTGGRGYGLHYLWNGIQPNTQWNDPENVLTIAPGPLCGNTQYPGSGKSLVVTLSPLTDIPIDSNVGGYFGPLLKFSGFDALVITGKAEHDVILVIDGVEGRVTLEEAPKENPDSHVAAEVFTRMYARDEKDLPNVSVVAAGRASEHCRVGCLNFSWYDIRRKCTRIKQAGRGGTGTVFRDKKLKALVVHGPRVTADANRPADLERIAKVGEKMHFEIHDYDDQQCHMRRQGTAHLVEIMDAYDLLPVHNFQYGNHPDTPKINSKVWDQRFTQTTVDGCWYGCSMACSKGADGFTLKTGPYRGHVVTVDGPEYETAAGLGSNCGIFDPHWILECNFYCDTYGVDTISYGTICAFVMECFQRGILNAERTGGLTVNFGDGAAQLELLHQLAQGKGLGAIAGQGVARMKKLFAEKGWGDPQLLGDMGMEVKGLEYSQYNSKESLAQQGGYALTNKGPQHDEAWLIFMDMVNKQLPTFEDKAEALHYFPLFRTWFGLCGLCKLPWNDIEPADNAKQPEPQKVPEHVQNYLNLFAGVTGREITIQDLLRMSERVYNFQRVFNLRMGKGRREHDQPPYRSIGPVTREEYQSRAERYDKELKEKIGVDPASLSLDEKIRRVREYRLDRYQKLCDAVYKRRGWTPDGIPTLETLQKLGMDLPEVVEVVRPHLKG